jgi:MFS family permease
VKIASLRALRHRNFRLYFFGQTISLAGTWMTRLATSWLVYRLTGSTLLLGVVSFAGQIPTFLLGPFAGVWVDRWETKKVILATQVLASLQSLILAALTLTGHITIPEVVVLSICQGLINAFDVPGRQTFLVQMVGRPDLGNAIALNSAMVNAARLVGPALAGLIIAMAGEGDCFLIDGLSYFAVIASLLMMRLEVAPARKAAASMLAQLREGWAYVSAPGPIRTVMTMFAIFSFMGVPYAVLMPVFATKILHGGPHTLGLLMGASGVGAGSAALVMAGRRSLRGMDSAIAASAGLMGAGLIAFSFSRNLWLSLALMAIAGFGMMMCYTASSTVIQTIVDEDKRGRVMSYWTMAYMGASPFGSLLAGGLAPVLGAPGTIIVCGLGCVAGGIWFWLQLDTLRGALRPIYERLGVMPAR